MKLDDTTSAKLDALLAGLPQDMIDALRELYVAENNIGRSMASARLIVLMNIEIKPA
jgi:hypothetical protein